MYLPTSSASRLIAGAVRREFEGDRVLLRPSGDGWSLMTPDGRVLLRGSGPGSRRRCLEYARAVGVLAVLH